MRELLVRGEDLGCELNTVFSRFREGREDSDGSRVRKKRRRRGGEKGAEEGEKKKKRGGMGGGGRLTSLHSHTAAPHAQLTRSHPNWTSVGEPESVRR